MGLRRPPKPCITPGCSQYALGTARRPRCATCQRAYDRARNADPKRAPYRDPVYRAIPIVGQCQHPGCESPAETRDHIKPLSKGGTNAPANIGLLCRFHNSQKHDSVG